MKRKLQNQNSKVLGASGATTLQFRKKKKNSFFHFSYFLHFFIFPFFHFFLLGGVAVFPSHFGCLSCLPLGGAAFSSSLVAWCCFGFLLLWVVLLGFLLWVVLLFFLSFCVVLPSFSSFGWGYMQKDRRNATPPRDGGDHAAPPNRIQGKSVRKGVPQATLVQSVLKKKISGAISAISVFLKCVRRGGVAKTFGGASGADVRMTQTFSEFLARVGARAGCEVVVRYPLAVLCNS